MVARRALTVLSLLNLRTASAETCETSLLQATHQNEPDGAGDGAQLASLVEDSAITNLMVSNRSCQRLGPHWSSYATSKQAHLHSKAGVGGLGSSWLQLGVEPAAGSAGSMERFFCVERKPTSKTVLAELNFRVGTAEEPGDVVCRRFGRSFHATPSEPLSSNRTDQKLWLCGRHQPRNEDLWMTTIHVGTAYKECMPWLRVDVNFVKIHTGGQRLKGIVPDFDTLLFCQHKRLSAYEEDRRKMQGTSPLPGEMSFPTKLLPVGQDTGNATRRHVFVVGPEGSSTRFWTMLMGAGLGMDIAKLGNQEGGTNHIINNQAALFHVSLPFGTTCEGQAVQTQPVLLDFGGEWKAYESSSNETEPVRMSFDLLLYHIDPLEVVKNHHLRGDQVTMVVVIRDPRACLADKVLNHCKKPHVGREEQKKAYDLMLKAAQSEEKDVVVVCYEEMLQKGADYVHQKLALMGVMNSENFDLDDGNAKYDLEGHDCGRDMLAYAQLCPNTALAREVNASC